MKSPIPPTVIMFPRNPGLESSMMETTSEITPRCQHLTPNRDVSHVWTDPLSLMRSTSPFELNSGTPANHHTSTPVRSIASAKKSLCVTKHHPYVPRSSINSLSGTHQSLKPVRHSYRRCSPINPKPDDNGNLFLEGFTDCASEVLRFLREVECVEDSNPLFQGLQSHLSKVRHTICPENISYLKEDHFQNTTLSPNQNHKVVSENQNLSCRTEEHQEIASRVPDINPATASFVTSQSPIHTSLQIDSDSSYVSESLLPSDAKWKEHLVSTSAQSNQNKIQSSQTPFNSRIFTNRYDTSPKAPTSSKHIHVPHISPSDRISVCLSNTSHTSKDSLASPTATDTADCSKGNMLPATDSSKVHTTRSSRVLDISREDKPNFLSSPLHLQPNASSEVLSTSHSLPEEAISKFKTLGSSSLHLNGRNMELIIPLPETQSDLVGNNRSALNNTHEDCMAKKLCCTDILQNIDPVVSWCLQPPELSASSLSMLSSQPLSLPIPLTNLALAPTSHNDFQPKLDPAQISDAILPELKDEQQTTSVLELRPNFLPGVTSSSVASGNFADVLLAIESCRGHDDSRVRALAEELIYLIHNDEDILSDEEDDDFDVSEDVVSDNEVPGEESGIEMDDSWSNAADLIEQ